MLNKGTLEKFLQDIEFTKNENTYERYFETYDCFIRVNMDTETIQYPEDKGLTICRYTTCNFEQDENFVELDCMCRLLKKGYNPAHITLEPKFKVGHGASGGWADIMVSDNSGKTLMIIECKTAGDEYNHEWKKMKYDGVKQSEGQFFTPIPIAKFIVSSLPLDDINSDLQRIPRVVDYACGAGHFLNEYAIQIKKYIDMKKYQEYCSNIVGIEKEYRLSKVAKVSAFMYGQDNIQMTT